MPSVDIKNFTEGLYTDVAIHNVPSGIGGTGAGLYVMDNVVTSYKIGSILKRPGYVQIGSVLEAGNSITGMFNYRESAATQVMLATVNDSTDDDTQLFWSTGAGWTEITGAETAWAGEANVNVEMEHFIGECFFVGHSTVDGFLPPRNYRHSTTTFGTNNTTSMPNAKYIKRYRDRLFIANTDIAGTATPFRVYYSTVPAAGAITWTTASNFFDVDYDEEITGIGVNWDRLMIFTEYSAYMVTGVSPLVRKKIWDRGCADHRTIKNHGSMMIWADMDGVWVSQGGGDPVNIAGRVIDFIKFSNMTNSFSEIVDEEYHLYIGGVTVNGITYANCTVILNIPTMTWRVHEYFDAMSIFAKFYSSGQDFLYMGATDGEVHRLGKYTDSTILTTDDTTPIHSWFQTGAMDFGVPAERKILNKMFAYADRAQGLMLKSRVVDANNQAVTEWKPLGELVKYINEFYINPDKANFIQIEGVENGSNQYWSLFGFSFDVEQEGSFK